MKTEPFNPISAEGSAEHLARLLNLGDFFPFEAPPKSNRLAGGEPVLIMTSEASIDPERRYRDRPILNLRVAIPEWLTADFLDVPAVIHTSALVAEKVVRENHAASVITADDYATGGSHADLCVAPIHGDAPLLSRWTECADLEDVAVKGVLSQKLIGGHLCPVLGLAVYLGRLNDPAG